MQSNLAVNKYLNTVASCWISSTYLDMSFISPFSINKDKIKMNVPILMFPSQVTIWYVQEAAYLPVDSHINV